MKILLFGKNGQVGWELQRSLAPLGEVVALDFDSRELCGDFTDLQGLVRTVEQLRPDVIVNAAAHTAVDKAESEPDLARVVNALAPEALAQAARGVGAWLVHYSTDYVFDGSGRTPWCESDDTAPLNIYGRTKREGEERIEAQWSRHLILRTSWVYAARGSNFAKTMLRLARERDSLTVIDDQVGAPTGAELLADVTAHAVRQVMQAEDAAALAGTYHVTAGGSTSWHGYAQLVLQTALEVGVALTVQPGDVRAVSTAAYPSPARRPLNSRLDCARFQQTFGLTLPPWQPGVIRMLREVL